MNPKIHFLIITSLFFLHSVLCFSQKAPIKFGKVSKEELLMTHYDQDTSAAAVILCDYGYYNANNNNFTRTVRIKILKKEGLDLANYIYRSDMRTSVKGITFNLENGEVIKSKLKKGSIYKEEINRYFSLIRLAMPNVKVGSVIDIQYFQSGINREWKFQYFIPVKWSELVIEDFTGLRFNKTFYGHTPLYISTNGRWVAKDVPAFKKEPYTNSEENYMTKFEFHSDLEFAEDSWKFLNKVFLKYSPMGSVSSYNRYLRDIVKEIDTSYVKDIDKINAAYRWVKRNKWNGKERVVPEDYELKRVIKKGSGNSAEINLIMVELLKKLGFDAYPVVLSTRSNGIISPITPNLGKFNYTVALIIFNDENILIDATEEYLPLGLLPPRCINLHGRLVDYKKSKWVELTTKTKENQIINYNLRLDKTGNLNGRLDCIRDGYGAYYFRKKFKEFNSIDDFLKDMEMQKTGLIINNYEINNFDSLNLPIKDFYDIVLESQSTKINDKIYINPMLTEQLTENPFKSDERKYPIDFIHPIQEKYILNLQIPENYSIESLPESLMAKLTDNSALFSYQVAFNNNMIQIKYQLNINKATFLTNQYEELRELYNQIIKKQQEQIILTKNNETI